jgi:hypothetical protein
VLEEEDVVEVVLTGAEEEDVETEDELTLLELTGEEVVTIDEDELLVVVGIEVLVDRDARYTPPTATIIMITITATIATILEIALILLAKRILEIKILNLCCCRLERIYGICWQGKIRIW